MSQSQKFAFESLLQSYFSTVLTFADGLLGLFGNIVVSEATAVTERKSRPYIDQPGISLSSHSPVPFLILPAWVSQPV